eukprot:467961-Pyramimonas_sp.AAC.1
MKPRSARSSSAACSSAFAPTSRAAQGLGVDRGPRALSGYGGPSAGHRSDVRSPCMFRRCACFCWAR